MKKEKKPTAADIRAVMSLLGRSKSPKKLAAIAANGRKRWANHKKPSTVSTNV